MQTQTISVQDFVTHIAAIPLLIAKVNEILHRVSNLQPPIEKMPEGDGWIGSKAAANYLGMSENTFEKFCCQTTPRIKRNKVGGKYYYKKTDLDSFMRLYEIKSKGLA